MKSRKYLREDRGEKKYQRKITDGREEKIVDRSKEKGEKGEVEKKYGQKGEREREERKEERREREEMRKEEGEMSRELYCKRRGKRLRSDSDKKF